ncbi:MAG: hypothetical protein ACYCTB_09060 [bacterium]
MEIFKIALKLYKHRIPAFAGMTPAACRKAKYPQSHSCVGRYALKPSAFRRLIQKNNFLSAIFS